MNRCIVLERSRPGIPVGAWLALTAAAWFALGVCLVLLLAGCGGRSDLSAPCELTAQNYEVTATIIETSCPDRAPVGTTNTGAVFFDPARGECSGRTLNTGLESWDMSTEPARFTLYAPDCTTVYSAILEVR